VTPCSDVAGYQRIGNAVILPDGLTTQKTATWIFTVWKPRISRQ